MLIFLFHKFNYWIQDVSYLTVNHSIRIGFRIICDVANHDNEDMIILCSGLANVLIFQSICPPCWDTSTNYLRLPVRSESSTLTWEMGEFAQIASTFVSPFEFFLPETFNSPDVSLQPAGTLFSNVVISFTPVKGGDIDYLT